MKKIILAKLLMVIFMLTLIGCSEEVYKVENFHSENKGKISLAQFKKETKIKDFDIFFKMPVSASVLNRTVDISEFVIDTVAIQKHISENNKTTYSFRVYTLILGAQFDEKYNLVYTKENNIWEKSIVAFKEKLQISNTENQLESFEKLYDSRFNNTMSANTEVCFSELYYVQCDGSCAREGYGQCDGFGCPTGQCVQHTITVGFCGGSGSGPTNPSGPTDTGSAVHLNPFEFTPNLYDNPVFDDSNYINAVRTQYFFDHLDYSAQMWLNEHNEVYHDIIQFLIIKNWSSTAEQSLIRLIQICIDNDARFRMDDTIISDNAMPINNLEQFQDLIDNIDENGTDYSYEQISPTQKTSTVKFWLGAFFGGIKVNVVQNISPTYEIQSINSNAFGLTAAFSWEQSSYDQTTNGNIVTVNINGVVHYNLFVERVGTVFSQNFHFEIKINRTSGLIISSRVVR